MSTIDEKKEQETNTNTPDFKGFATNYATSVIFTIGIAIFVIGTCGLYTTKVAQANVLPDNIDLAPYTVFDRVVTNNPIDINIIKPSLFSDSKDCFSQKAIFNSQEYLDSFSKSFLCSLKKSAEPSHGLFANAPLFFSAVYENIIAKNFLAINNIFLYLSYLPESLIMILYGLLGVFLWFGFYFFNVCVSIFYHFINIPQLFRTPSDKNEKQWESNDNISLIRFTKLAVFFFLWSWVSIISAFVSPIIFTVYGLTAPLFATYKIKQSPDKSRTIFDFIKDTFAYKKLFFFILATLSLFSNGIKYLGNNAAIGIGIAVVFAYFMGLYNNDVSLEDGFTQKIRQNVKQSHVMEINQSNPKLVKVCKPIPVEQKVEQTGQFRPLTKEVDTDDMSGGVNPTVEQKGGRKTTKKYHIRWT